MGNKRRAEDAKLDMTPMIDIVFQMIIFFVVSIELDRQVINEQIILAPSPHGPAIEKRDPLTITVEVDPRGAISIARTEMSVATLTAILTEARGRYGQEVPVHIRADHKATHNHIRSVMSAAGRAGLWRISIVALKEEGEKR